MWSSSLSPFLALGVLGVGIGPILAVANWSLLVLLVVKEIALSVPEPNRRLVRVLNVFILPLFVVFVITLGLGALRLAS